MHCGDLRERIVFEARVAVDDAAGAREGEFIDQFTLAARIQPLRGGEEVMAQRLEGVQPVIILVRASTISRRIAADWRARDDRNGMTYAITAPPVDMLEDRRFLTILAATEKAA
jgi:head-tail adaptor